MLRKLIKYDILADYKKYGIAFIGLILTSALLLFMSKATSWMRENPLLEAVTSMLSAAFVMATMLLFAMVVVFAAVRFYKNLVRDEGYLMHTLPVPTWKLLTSKLISTYIWFAAAAVVMCISIGISVGDFFWIFKLITQKEEIMNALYEAGIQISVSQYTKFIALACVTLLVSPCMFMTHIYLSLALGNLFSKHKLGWAVLMFFGIYIAEQIISTIFMMFMSVDTMEIVISSMTDEAALSYGFDFITKSFTFSIVLSVVLSVCFFI